MQATQSLLVQEVPQNKLRGKSFSNWSRRDIRVVLNILLIIIAAGVWLHALGQDAGAALAIAVLIVGLTPLLIRLPHGYGRLYDEVASGFRGEIRQLLLKGVWWQADDTDSRFIRWLRYRRTRHGVIPLKLGVIQAKMNGRVQQIALLRELDEPYDHLFIAASGGKFSSLDPNAQQRATDELARITNRVVVQADLKLGISYLRMTGPYDPTKTLQYLQKNTNPVVAHPEQFELDEDTRAWATWLNENGNQLRPAAKRFGAADSWYLIVITIKRTREWRSASKGKLSDEELYELPIIELGRALEESLGTSSMLGLQDVHCVGLAELSCIVRCSWDVVGIEQYYHDRATGKIPTTDEEIDRIRQEHGDDAVDAALQTWPSRIIETPGKGRCIRFDDNYIAVARTVELPERTRADQFMSLHYKARIGVWSRMAMVGQSVSGRAETRNLIIGESALLNMQTAFFSNRVVQNPRWRRKQQLLQQQSNQISAHTVAQQFNTLHTVVANSEREALRQLRELRAAIADNGHVADIVTPPDRQLAAAITGCLGINRL
jgi:hypothetical protein